MIGKKEKLNINNLYYNSFLPYYERTFENASIDENGNLTLLGDSLILKNGTFLNISSIRKNTKTGNIYVEDINGKIINLSLLSKDTSIVLRKYDETTIIKNLYSISDTTESYYEIQDIVPIPSKSKDYIKSPKDYSHYMALHKSYIDKISNLAFELQDESMSMYTSSKTNSPVEGHDTFKKSKLEKHKNNPILAKILERDPYAFDTSTQALKILINNPSVEMSEVLGKYIVTLTINNETVTYQPTIDEIFKHTFHTSYKDFINQKNGFNDLRII